MSDTHTTRRILVPLDGTETAMAVIPWIRALVTDDTQLLLLHVATLPVPMADIAGMAISSYEAAQDQEIRIGSAYLENVSEGLADAATRITKLSRIGNPPDEILEVAETHEADLILMATHGRGVAGRIAIGSVADRVARAATAPVMLIHASYGDTVPSAGARATCRGIVVPLDGSALARTALPVAAELARHFGVPARVVRVIPERNMMLATRRGRQTDTLYRQLLDVLPMMKAESDTAWYEEYTTSVADALATEAARLHARGVTATSEVLIGEPAPAIAEALRPDEVIVMTSHGAGGIRRWLMGSVAEKLIHRAAAPLVLVPAPGREQVAPAPERPSTLDT